MTTTGIDAYRTVKATTADPVALTTLLFDEALKAIKRARLLHERGKRQGFLDEAERAQLLVGELLCSLDLEQGELAKSLSAIYAYCLRLIVESTAGDMEKLDEALKHVQRIAAAWKRATAGLRGASEGPAGKAA